MRFGGVTILLLLQGVVDVIACYPGRCPGLVAALRLQRAVVSRIWIQLQPIKSLLVPGQYPALRWTITEPKAS